MNLVQTTRDRIVEIVDLTQTCNSQLAANLYASAQDRAGALSVPEIALRLETARNALKAGLPEVLISREAEGNWQTIIRSAIPEIVELTAKLFSDAAANAYGKEIDKTGKLLTREIDHRLAVAAQALQGRAPLLLAGLMVQSYTFDHKTGVSNFAIPLGCSDEAAMAAINLYFETYQANPWGAPFRAAISEEALRWLTGSGESHFGYAPLPVRDCSTVRRVTIHSLAKDTFDQDQATQAHALGAQSLVFSDPREIALAAGLHACKHGGQNLFAGYEVRCSIEGVSLYADWSGVTLRFNVPNTDKRLAAAGTPVATPV